MKSPLALVTALFLVGGLLLPLAAGAAGNASLPRLIDLGADKCIPCRMMFPVLDEIKSACAGKLQVEFIDVWKHPDQAEPYGVRMIPTQIFFSAQGKELFRHQGFIAEEDILAKWRELGYDFNK
jgi:thioredoxin